MFQDYKKACQGYGIYAGLGAIPSLSDVLQNIDKYIVVEGGIQVLRQDLRKPGIDALGQTNLALVGPDGPFLEGSATADLMGLNVGGGWAADYLAEGYAIMGDRTSLGKGLTGKIAMASAPGYISDLAGVGGDFIVIDAPAQLLAEAQKLAQGIPPGITDPSQPTKPTPVPGEEPGDATPGWVVPAVVGVGLITVAALWANSRK